MKVLVAEDMPRMANLLGKALYREGHSVVIAHDGEQALAIGRSCECDVLLLDVMLPRMDGFTVIKTLRAEQRTTPTIILSARDAMSDIVKGLDCGADDYLTKPFALDVLLARIRAVARRSPMMGSLDLSYEDLLLDSRTHELRRGSRSASLTRTEFALLEVLMRRAGTIVMRDTLLDAGWGFNSDVNEGTLYVFISALRAKIAVGSETQLLHTARGVGYTLRRQSA